MKLEDRPAHGVTSAFVSSPVVLERLDVTVPAGSRRISTASDIRKREVDEVAVDRIVGDPSTHACFAEQSDDDSLGFGSGARAKSVSSREIVAIPGGPGICGVRRRG